MIRRILVDYGRKRRAAKRGGPSQVPLDETVLGSKARGVDVEALDEALIALSKIDRRKARVVEFRFFSGLSVKKQLPSWRFPRKPLSATGGQPTHGCSVSLRKRTQAVKPRSDVVKRCRVPRERHECVTRMRLVTKFLSVKTPVTIGSRFGDWRVCWLDGWTRFRLAFLVMVVRVVE
jgi:hypothetical protein